MILDLFAGPGGWDEGLRLLGQDDVLGVETDKDAVETRFAAGHDSIRIDVRKLRTDEVDPLTGLIASPPCQTFSDAGKQAGKGSLGDLICAARRVLEGEETAAAATKAGLDGGDPRSTLVLEPLRFIRDHQPAWVAFEEVRGVLPVWKAYAHLLGRYGYSTWAGLLNAADYGVPQARKRAFLLASRGRLGMPQASHTQVDGRGASGHESVALDDLFGGLRPWVTMAEALGLTADDLEPLQRWALRRPATTIVRSFRPEIIAAPGYRTVGDPSRQNAPGSIEVTPEQMCVLQGLRTDYPFQGAESKRLSLIGAILPPPWAAAILRPLIDSTTTTTPTEAPMPYDDDRPGMMRVHVAQRRGDELCARYTRDTLREMARQRGVPAGHSLKRDLAVALAMAGVR